MDLGSIPGGGTTVDTGAVSFHLRPHTIRASADEIVMRLLVSPDEAPIESERSQGPLAQLVERCIRPAPMKGL